MGTEMRRVLDITRRNLTSVIFILTQSRRSICLYRLDFVRAISNVLQFQMPSISSSGEVSGPTGSDQSEGCVPESQSELFTVSL